MIKVNTIVFVFFIAISAATIHCAANKKSPGPNVSQQKSEHPLDTHEQIQQLTQAIENWNEPSIEKFKSLIIENPALVNAQEFGPTQATPLLMLLYKGYKRKCLQKEHVTFLLDHGANPNIPGKLPQKNPLNFATCFLNPSSYPHAVEIVQLLLEHGANPNQLVITKSGTKYSPLDNAATSVQSSEMVKLLLDYGADKNMIVYNGLTAAENARELGMLDIADIIEAYGSSTKNAKR